MRASEFVSEVKGHDFMAGHCHVMAMALKQLHPDWQIRAHVGYDDDAADDTEYRVDHVYTVAPDGTAYDCRGRFDNEQQLVGPDTTGGVDTQYVNFGPEEIKQAMLRGELKRFTKQDLANAMQVATQAGKQDVSEAPAGYKEIEFVCVNPQFPDATDPALQKKMYRGLKQIDGVVPLWQEWGDYSEGQASLSAIYQDSDSRDKILSLAKQLGVKVDLEQAVSADYVDRAMRGEHEGQRGLAEGQDNLSYIGNCTDDDVIEHVFGDATGFAQAVEEYGDEFVLDDLVVKYDPETDVHSFYYQQQGLTERKQSPLEDFEGLQFRMVNDNDQLFVNAFDSSGSNELGHVTFDIGDGKELDPQNLYVKHKFRSQGIARTMYDFVKSKGYKIQRSWDQTDAGAGFWDKHRGEERVWEQGVAEGLDQDIPSVLYHATYKPRLKSIQLKGLGSGGRRNWEDSQRGVVYLALDPDVAESYAETSDMVPDEWLDQIVMLKISTAGLDPNKFGIDSNVQDNAGDTIEYHGVIPVSNISLYKSGVAEGSSQQHTEIIKHRVGDWIVYLDNHSVIRAMTRNIGPRMMSNLVTMVDVIPDLEDKVPKGGAFWIQDIKTNSSFYFKRLDIPSEPLAVRCETGVQDIPRANKQTPVFRVNAYTGPETKQAIQGMKQAKLRSKFVGTNTLANTLATNIQKGRIGGDDAIRNPATQDSKRYDTAFKQAQRMDKEVDENFADGRHPEDKGDAKRHGINTKASVSSLRKTAKQGGRKGQLAHWLANMKSGRAKKK
jgi:hypothetical protein